MEQKKTISPEKRFEELSRPLMNFLSEFCSPDSMIIIKPDKTGMVSDGIVFEVGNQLKIEKG